MGLTQGNEHCQTTMAYMGSQSKTLSNRTCQKWNQFNEPHDHGYKDRFLFPNADMNHSACRNPDHNVLGPWCYTTDPNVTREFCFYSKSKSFEIKQKKIFKNTHF